MSIGVPDLSRAQELRTRLNPLGIARAVGGRSYVVSLDARALSSAQVAGAEAGSVYADAYDLRAL